MLLRMCQSVRSPQECTSDPRQHGRTTKRSSFVHPPFSEVHRKDHKKKWTAGVEFTGTPCGRGVRSEWMVDTMGAAQAKPQLRSIARGFVGANETLKVDCSYIVRFWELQGTKCNGCHASLSLDTGVVGVPVRGLIG